MAAFPMSARMPGSTPAAGVSSTSFRSRRITEQSGLPHQAARPNLVAHRLDDVGARSYEGQAALNADFSQRWVLGQEAVAGMDRVGAGDERGAHHVGYVKVAALAGCRPDTDGLVG